MSWQAYVDQLTGSADIEHACILGRNDGVVWAKSPAFPELNRKIGTVTGAGVASKAAGLWQGGLDGIRSASSSSALIRALNGMKTHVDVVSTQVTSARADVLKVAVAKRQQNVGRWSSDVADAYGDLLRGLRDAKKPEAAARVKAALEAFKSESKSDSDGNKTELSVLLEVANEKKTVQSMYIGGQKFIVVGKIMHNNTTSTGTASVVRLRSPGTGKGMTIATSRSGVFLALHRGGAGTANGDETITMAEYVSTCGL